MRDERAEKASQAIQRQHDICAKWARLHRYAPDQAGFQRAAWYEVVDFNLETGLATLEVDGNERLIHYSLVMWSADMPKKVVVFRPRGASSPPLDIGPTPFEARCPRRHLLGSVTPRDGQTLACEECNGKEYEWEFE